MLSRLICIFVVRIWQNRFSHDVAHTISIRSFESIQPIDWKMCCRQWKLQNTAQYRIMEYFRVAKFSRFCLKTWRLFFADFNYQFSLDKSKVRKENLWPKYLEQNGIKDYLQSDRQTNKNNILTFRRLNTMTVQYKTMKCLVLLACYVVSYDTFCHKTTCGVFWM